MTLSYTSQVWLEGLLTEVPEMRVFDCESAIANFFPSLFSEDKKTWEQYAQGEFLFDTMKGDHISCMNSPYIEENVKKILDL